MGDIKVGSIILKKSDNEPYFSKGLTVVTDATKHAHCFIRVFYTHPVFGSNKVSDHWNDNKNFIAANFKKLSTIDKEAYLGFLNLCLDALKNVKDNTQDEVTVRKGRFVLKG